MESNERKLTRRDFLIAAGCGCAGLVVAGIGSSRLRGTTATAALVCPYGYRYDPWPGQCYRYVDSNGSGYCDYSEAATVTTVDSGAATSGTTTTQVESAAAGATTTAVLCNRGCSYPGQCGRFVDSDGSGICDLSEGVSVQSSAAASSSTATATAAATPAATTAASATAVPAATATATAAAVELVILCDRGCSYPGNCGRYTDANDTGRCDLSEGIPADQAANYAGESGSRGRGGRGG